MKQQLDAYSDQQEAIPELDFEREIPLDWSEGVDHLKDKSMEDLWALLGRANDNSIPFFNQRVDSEGIRDPWDSDDKAWINSPQNDTVELQPRWHQLVGILRMLERIFEDKPVLLMDEVGLGKTLQVVGVFAFLAYFHECHKMTGDFPGYFGIIDIHFKQTVC